MEVGRVIFGHKLPERSDIPVCLLPVPVAGCVVLAVARALSLVRLSDGAPYRSRTPAWENRRFGRPLTCPVVLDLL